MPKFSIIIPVYRVEKYIKRCLDSVFNQTFKDYEVIVINDGTDDNSMEIVNNYDVKIINQENRGLSSARNRGVEKACGEYIFFLDSDDYIEKELLDKINLSLDNDPDIVRFQLREIYEDHEKDHYEKEFIGLKGEEAFTEISAFDFVEPAVLYFIKREYYQKENYKFLENTYHEDYGLIPLVIMKAKTVNSINYIGYNYIQRKNSIMSSNSYNKTKKKVEDFYKHYLYLIDEINKTKLNSKVFKSFISNSLIIKICNLNKKDYKEYKNKLKENKVFDNLLDDNFIRKIKKVLLKISPKLTRKLLR